jgi:hypothetical protein
MRIPGVNTLSRIPVPPIVQAALAPVVRQSTMYAVSLAGALDHLATVAIAEVVRRVDVEPVLDGLDLTEIVLQRVDLDAVVRTVIANVDEDEIATVVAKVDVNAIAGTLDIDRLLDQMDLTAIVLSRVDLVKVVDAVLDQMDLIALANEIIEGVDLPEIIRDSTGSMASETVKGVRLQGIGADQAVDRAIDRLLLRRARTNGPAGS